MLKGRIGLPDDDLVSRVQICSAFFLDEKAGLKDKEKRKEQGISKCFRGTGIACVGMNQKSSLENEKKEIVNISEECLAEAADRLRKKCHYGCYESKGILHVGYRLPVKVSSLR